ncbi:unnamed protein product [Rotaria sp. Silwood1]|nr:unnamed protein product [Rotaria sp. Silwood1]CAF3443045.1 unnamed protein product [Rotaria sp. Silwood1]CAF3499932.1 unnamed protein product [Rotaria sp. Silwood1]CAF4818341.1 unnamed protein product [Rotaria sp. Silwood1]CAF5049032.1 unnamed protein product [Rotaria sp. Silwood1]
MFKAAILLSQQYHLTIEGQSIGWQTAETSGNVINALSSTCRAISTSNIVGIVGPALSREAHVIAHFAKAIGIPVISYSATDPDLSDRNIYSTFYRTVPSDNTAALSITKLFMRFNWTSCIIIYQNDAFGSGGEKAIIRAFQNNGLIVRKSLVFDITTHQIRGDLKNELISSSTRLVILWVESTFISLILQKAIDQDVLGPQFTWILLSNVPLNSFDQNSYQKLIGMLTIEPTIGYIVNTPINSTLLDAAYNIWKQYEPESFPGRKKVNNHALFAFDATWSLIQSLERFCSLTNTWSSSCVSILNSSFCFDHRFLHTNTFFDTTMNMTFLGVSGPIQFNTNVTDRISGNYYLVQNIQPYENHIDYVPVLEWSDIDDWKSSSRRNVIVWPGNTLIPPTGHPSLSSTRLRIGVIESKPFTMITNVIDEFGQSTTKLIGFVPDLIDLLQEKMKFIHQILLAPSNQTYAELVRAVINGDYDIVIGDVTITASRREKVGFSNSIFDNSLRIIMRKNIDDNVDFLSFLRPFSFSLWILLFITSIYAGVLICILERPENEALHGKSIISSTAMSLWYAIGTIMGYGADFHASTAAGRLLTLGLYFLSLVLVATYTANLASDLTISKSKSLITSIDDIKNGKIPFHRIGIRIGTAGEEYYLREISGGNRNYYSLKSRQELYESLLNDIIDASFIDTGVGEYITNTFYCNLTLIGADFDKGAFGVVLPKQWVYGQELDVSILSLRESGALDDLKRKWFQTSSCPDTSVASTSTAIETMSGLFLTFAMISVLSLLLFAWKKRFIIQNYLWKRLCRKVSLAFQDTSTIRHSTEISKYSESTNPVSCSKACF